MVFRERKVIRVIIKTKMQNNIMVMELDSEYKQCNVLKPGGKITLSEKVKDFHKIPFFGLHENQEEKPEEATTPNCGTVNILLKY